MARLFKLLATLLQGDYSVSPEYKNMELLVVNKILFSASCNGESLRTFAGESIRREY